MGKRIPRHVREAAICALEWAATIHPPISAWGRVSATSDWFDLAVTASRSAAIVCPALYFDPYGRRLEAAALLKEGWSPGDPVVRWRRG